MAPRIISQILLTGGKMIFRATAEAYQAVRNDAVKSGVAAHANSKDAATRITGMTLGEAKKILNIDNIHAKEELLKKYDFLYKANEVENGGSFYLQSKVFRAKERIDLELEKDSNKL